MKKLLTKFIRKELVANDTYACYFDKPQDFIFRAGQFVEVTLPTSSYSDKRGLTREMSLASAPHERELAIAFRFQDSAFKRTLLEMKGGEEIQIEGPFGAFTLHDDVDRPAIFLAGGIGVVPFLSIVINAAHRGHLPRMHLFYSNRHPVDAAFLSELRIMEKNNSNFTVVPTMTKTNWEGERGYITMEMITKYAQDISKAVFYIAGPLAMCVGVQMMLNKHGIDDSRILVEEFVGY
jgi:ferredoxin-NADP reductase